MIPVREPLKRRALKWLARTEIHLLWKFYEEAIREAFKKEGYYISKWPGRKVAE